MPSPLSIASSYRILGHIAEGEATLDRQGRFWHATLVRPGVVPSPAQALVTVVDSDPTMLAVAFGPGPGMEIGIYRFNGTKGQSLWCPPGASGDDLSICGREELTRSGDVLTIDRARAIDASTYSGRIVLSTVTPAAAGLPGIVDMRWELNDGVYESFGLDFGSTILTCWNLGEPGPHGIGGYVATPGGLSGVFVKQYERTVSRETWLIA